MNNQWPYYYHPYSYHPQAQTSMIHQNDVKEEKKQENIKARKENDSKISNQKSLADVLEKLYEKLEKIEQENQELKEKVNNIKPINIENVNYKIQDLSVEELSGTLLVGLTSLTDAEELKKLLSDNGPVTLNDIDTSDMETILENAEITPENDENNNGNENNDDEFV
ncbi:spore germination protein GerPC [Bacillus sp. B15-48]|uniref:spore germination protein GerPC n=1 Tax=Bacillus sp. B15-48 TaxID=1548601 RepID=UPI00193F1D9E|nr:spore germination protein GerPC [Bacillus sp. B15-48]MBM4765219.1 hypothetical protein [Bacillus sp. B15-48]